MAQITVENLGKIYRVAARDPGLAGAFRGLFRRRHKCAAYARRSLTRQRWHPHTPANRSPFDAPGNVS